MFQVTENLSILTSMIQKYCSVINIYIVIPPEPNGVTTSFGYEWGYRFGNITPNESFWFTHEGGALFSYLPSMNDFTFESYGS